MSKFIVEQSVWDLFPEARIGIVLAREIDNSEEGTRGVRSEILRLLEEGNASARTFLGEGLLSERPVVAVWREAYRRFKTKKGARSSIESLLKRVEKGSGVGSINPLVDLYNAVSLSFGLPCGGEDRDTFQGDLRLTVTGGGDAFMALGDEKDDPTLPGEVCYLDDVGAVCRCWNWRDGQRTMLTERTRNAILIIESVDPTRTDDLNEALITLAARTRQFLGGSAEVRILDRNNRQTDLYAVPEPLCPAQPAQ